MFRALRGGWLIGLGIGLVCGLIFGGFWPDTPLHATATDRAGDSYIIATGLVDEETEGLYFLDCLTGDLGIGILNPYGKFQGNRIGPFATPVAARNILTDFGVDPAKSPRFLMVTGLARTQRSAGPTQRSRSYVYVMEVTSGKMVAYTFHWTGTIARGAGTLVPEDGIVVRAAVGAGVGAPGGAVPPTP